MAWCRQAAISSLYLITVSHHNWSLEGKMLDVLIASLFLYILWELVQNILLTFSDVCQFLGK